MTVVVTVLAVVVNDVFVVVIVVVLVLGLDFPAISNPATNEAMATMTTIPATANPVAPLIGSREQMTDRPINVVDRMTGQGEARQHHGCGNNEHRFSRVILPHGVTSPAEVPLVRTAQRLRPLQLAHIRPRLPNGVHSELRKTATVGLEPALKGQDSLNFLSASLRARYPSV